MKASQVTKSTDASVGANQPRRITSIQASGSNIGNEMPVMCDSFNASAPLEVHVVILLVDVVGILNTSRSHLKPQ